MATAIRYVRSSFEDGVEVLTVSAEPFADGIQVRVEVPVDPDTTPAQVRVQALTLAQPLLAPLLRSPRAERPSSKPEPLRPRRPPDELVFEPDAIVPFLIALLPMMAAVARKPIRVELTSEEPTASTDCKSVVHFNPQPYLEGKIEAGDGRGLHEVSHIRFSPRGAELMERATDEGGSRLAHLFNLILDRRDDDRNCREHPGYALRVRRRLADLMPGPDGARSGVSEDGYTSVFTDFAYACKKRTRPRHAVVRRCIQIVNQYIKRANASRRANADDALLEAAKKVKAILDPFEPERSDAESDAFERFMQALLRAIRGGRVSPTARAAFRQAMGRWHAANRRKTLHGLSAAFHALPTRATVAGGSLQTGGGSSAGGQIHRVPPNADAYSRALARVRPYVAPLRQTLYELALPETRVERGLDEGELDFDALAVLASGGRDCMMREDEERRLDLAVVFVNDISGSRFVDTFGMDLGVAFNESLVHGPSGVEATFLAFHDDVFDCGRAQPANGIASLKAAGSTNEAFALQVAGQILARSARRRKLIFVACDGGPNDVRAVETQCRTLMTHGILPIRLLIGVDAAPRTYPVELFFNNYEDLFRDLVSLFRSILYAARS